MLEFRKLIPNSLREKYFVNVHIHFQLFKCEKCSDFYTSGLWPGHGNIEMCHYLDLIC